MYFDVTPVRATESRFGVLANPLSMYCHLKPSIETRITVSASCFSLLCARFVRMSKARIKIDPVCKKILKPSNEASSAIVWSDHE
ncbi:hypothetical protein ACROYT_G039594 [Oculina patagonica]